MFNKVGQVIVSVSDLFGNEFYSAVMAIGSGTLKFESDNLTDVLTTAMDWALQSGAEIVNRIDGAEVTI